MYTKFKIKEREKMTDKFSVVLAVLGVVALLVAGFIALQPADAPTMPPVQQEPAAKQPMPIDQEVNAATGQLVIHFKSNEVKE